MTTSSCERYDRIPVATHASPTADCTDSSLLPAAMRLPAETICSIVHICVLEDTAPRTSFPLPLSRNRLWADLLARSPEAPLACVVRKRDCEESGFVARTLSCSLFSQPGAPSPYDESDTPETSRHAVLRCGQVCRSWRQAIHGYSTLWASSGLLNLGHIGRSYALGEPRPLKLMNPRPLCACFLEHCIPFLSSATSIAFTTYALGGRSGVLVSETVLLELEAAFRSPQGCKLTYLDLQLTRPDCSAEAPMPATTSIRIDSLVVAQLSNTHFRCFGTQLQRLELLTERDSWRLLPADIYDTLSLCPNLEHLTLCTVCKDLPHLTLNNAYNENAANIIHLSKLSCFILEDTTNECLHMLSCIAFPPDCDFHWTIVEPFGRQGYFTNNLSASLAVSFAAFNHKTYPSFRPSVLLIEILLDFEGRHLQTNREVYEWPEEMRLTFSTSESSATGQYVTRHPSLRGRIYRDFSHSPGSPRRSLGVRSQMLSKYPEEKNQRQRPMRLSHSSARKPLPVDVPSLEDVISAFMVHSIRLEGFISAGCVIVPSHAYIPRTEKAWRTLLKDCDLETLVLGTVTLSDELYSLCEYLASPSKTHPELSAIHCRNYVGDGKLSQKTFGSHMKNTMGERRGCTDIAWYAPLLK